MKRPQLKRLDFNTLRIKEDSRVCKKTYFGTEKDANEFINKLQKTSVRDKVPVNSYLCAKCKCWHITSWSAPDINKLIDEFNEEVNILIDAYNHSVEHSDSIIKNVFNYAQQIEIENMNLKDELYKLNKKYL